MLIYEVNLNLHPSIVKDYAEMVKSHISTMLKLEGFVEAHWYQEQPEALNVMDEDPSEAPVRWVLHYHIKDRFSLERYFNNEGRTLRGEGIRKFGDKVKISRRILLPRGIPPSAADLDMSR